MRTGTGPPALLPPRSPRLGPIVWLGAPGRREDGGGEEKKKEGKREGGGWSRRRGRERKPCAKRSVSQVSPEIKLFQFKHLLSSPPFPRRSGSPESGLRRPGRGKPTGWRASVAAQPRSPPPVAAEAAATSPSRGTDRVPFETRNQNKQLKMAATLLRHPPLGDTAPSSLRLRTPADLTICAKVEGRRDRKRAERHGYPTGRRDEWEERLRTRLQRRGPLKLNFLYDIPASKGSLR